MAETGNRVAIQEGYVLPFHSYGGRPKAHRSHASRRGHGPKSAAYKAQQSKMKKCAKLWRDHERDSHAGGRPGAYRAFMRGCLKRRG